jgi:phosphopantothenoylcysteine decarboxylase/phosphopantothenate--cysteine ligase
MKARAFWRGKKVVITAGPTREYLDPVRYITNASSGRMGYALAARAHSLGAQVVLISGPVMMKPPRGVNVLKAVTAVEMRRLALKAARHADVFIGAAAVSDWRPQHRAPRKIKKAALKNLAVKFVPNPDVIKSVARARRGDKPFILGFALETEDLMQNAQDKMRRKNLDAVVANPAGVIDKDATKAFYLNRAGAGRAFSGHKRALAAKIFLWIQGDLA